MGPNTNVLECERFSIWLVYVLKMCFGKKQKTILNKPVQKSKQIFLNDYSLINQMSMLIKCQMPVSIKMKFAMYEATRQEIHYVLLNEIFAWHILNTATLQSEKCISGYNNIYWKLFMLTVSMFILQQEGIRQQMHVQGPLYTCIVYEMFAWHILNTATLQSKKGLRETFFWPFLRNVFLCTIIITPINVGPTRMNISICMCRSQNMCSTKNVRYLL